MSLFDKIFSKRTLTIKNNDDLFSCSAHLIPWYINNDSPKLFCGGTQLKWDFIKEANGECLGSIILKNGFQTVGIFNSYVYILPVFNHQAFCVWTRHHNNGIFNIELYYVDDLSPISDEKSEALRLKKQKLPYMLNSNPASKVEFVVGIQQTELSFNFPKEFEEVDDFIMVLDIPGMYTKKTSANTALVEMSPKAGRISIYPQDWFNKDKQIDFGYQWITMAAKDAPDRGIIGRGIRLGVFELDMTKRNIKDWINKDPFGK